MSTVLVTGGTGFIAGWCIVQLLDAGHEVVTTVRSTEKEPAVRDAVAARSGSIDALRFVLADLTVDEGWDGAMAGCDYVLHVASPLAADASDAGVVRPTGTRRHGARPGRGEPRRASRGWS